MPRPNLEDEFIDKLDKALIELGYKEHVVRGATHAQKVAWLIIETDADVDVSEYI